MIEDMVNVYFWYLPNEVNRVKINSIGIIVRCCMHVQMLTHSLIVRPYIASQLQCIFSKISDLNNLEVTRH